MRALIYDDLSMKLFMVHRPRLNGLIVVNNDCGTTYYTPMQRAKNRCLHMRWKLMRVLCYE